MGDNFIGPAVKQATPVSTVLSGLTLGTHYSDVKRLNASTGQLESYAGGAFTHFEPGKGYILVGLQDTSFSYGKTEQITTFVYDSTGSRVKKSVQGLSPEGTVPSETVYLGKDYEIEGTKETKHLFLGDRRLVTRHSSPGTETFQFIHSDHINSSNILTDPSGNRTGLLEYDPYGTTVTQSGTTNPQHKFTGQEEDSSTRLYSYGGRYYDPATGRFLTSDPFIQDPPDPQSFNRFAYARNNPLLYTDPSGFFFGQEQIDQIRQGERANEIQDRYPKLHIEGPRATYRLFNPSQALARLRERRDPGRAVTLLARTSQARRSVSQATPPQSFASLLMGEGPSPPFRFPHLDYGAMAADMIFSRGEGAKAAMNVGNVPTYSIGDMPNLGGLGAASTAAMQAAANVKAGVANPLEGVYNANQARSGGRKFNIPKALSKFWNSLKPFREGIKRDDEGNYYRWDHSHNDIEKYDKKSRKELASLDPETGQPYRRGSGRKLEI